MSTVHPSPELLRAAGEHVVRFSYDDLVLFTNASGDRNPLHLYPEYARSTPMGNCWYSGTWARSRASGKCASPPAGS
jgi:acyl dehydratase